MSFQLYTDSGLTTLFSGTETLTHQTNFSDNPQTFTLYYGSPTTGRVLQAVSNPGVDQITITPTDTTPLWVLSTAYSLGQAIEPATPNGYWYSCTTAGTTSSSAPTWPTSGIGSTVTDGTVVWTLQGATHPITEVKLALTSAGLSSATAGAALNLGTAINSGTSNAVALYVKITNSVSTVSNDTTYPQLGLYVNLVQESN